MDEVEVQIVGPQPFQRGVKGPEGGVIAHLGFPQLGGEEKVLSGNIALRHGLAKSCLGAVEGGGVKVAVPLGDGVGQGGAVPVAGLVGAEANGGDGQAVGENKLCCRAVHTRTPFSFGKRVPRPLGEVNRPLRRR